MFKLDIYMYLVLVPGVLLFTVCVADVSTQTWFYCFGDYCNVKKNITEEFCSVKFQKCRPCSEVVDDCFTPEMPLNCTLTCLDQYKERILKEEIAKPCQEIQEIDNGNHNGSHLNILEPGIIIHYSCISGHRLVGFDDLQCMQYGQWSSPPPRCEEVLCPVLSPIRNGNHNGSLKRHAPTVTIITLCDDGFQLIGENSTTCSGDGQWTNHLPTCKPMFCEKLPPIRHGKWVQLDEHTDHFTHGDTLYAQCDTDYKIDNPSAWICQKGLWTSNVSFVPNCFTQGESCHNSSLLTIVIIVGGVLFLFLIICIIGNVYQYYERRKLKKYSKRYSQMDAEHGQQRCSPFKNMPESAEELQKLLSEKDKQNDSPDVVSLHGKNRIQGARDNVSQSQNVPPGSQPQLPEPSNIPDLNGGIIVKFNVNNIIENSNYNHAIVNTSDRNAGESDETVRKSAREEDRGNDTRPQEQRLPHDENDNTPVEERGVSYQPETPDPIDVSQEPDGVPNDSTQMQPVADNDVPARPEGVPSVMEPMESSHGIEQLNVDLPGGTVPMKSMSADFDAFVGTQPLKHDDDYTGNNDYTRVRDSRDADTSISQDESLNNIEIDEDDDTMSSQRVDGDHTDENVH